MVFTYWLVGTSHPVLTEIEILFGVECMKHHTFGVGNGALLAV